jgi:hypothetical protein
VTPRKLKRAAELEVAARRALLYFIMPLWMGAGLADWFQHRRTHIERTSGTHESALHLLMQAQAGAPLVLGLFFQVNAGVLLAALGAVLAHEATALWDVAYTETRRRVDPIEQHIHSFMEVGPLLCLTVMTVMHWDQARSLFGQGPARREFGLHLKPPPFGPSALLALLAGALACGLLPYLEEFWRCYRHNQTLAPLPEPPVPATPTLRIPA